MTDRIKISVMGGDTICKQPGNIPELQSDFTDGIHRYWRGLRMFIEEENGKGAVGANIGFVFALGSGSWEGLFADFSVSFSFFTLTYFESGGWKGVYVGIRISPPSPQITGGGAMYFRVPE